mmetsp:Transcript_19733/g.49597  ORF Transcript_19733/g.49597 Transcript_19733/m.49597 type:complete len:324 (+) Transcript_19733:294-1265(+)
MQPNPNTRPATSLSLLATRFGKRVHPLLNPGCCRRCCSDAPRCPRKSARDLCCSSYYRTTPWKRTAAAKVLRPRAFSFPRARTHVAAPLSTSAAAAAAGSYQVIRPSYRSALSSCPRWMRPIFCCSRPSPGFQTACPVCDRLPPLWFLFPRAERGRPKRHPQQELLRAEAHPKTGLGCCCACSLRNRCLFHNAYSTTTCFAPGCLTAPRRGRLACPFPFRDFPLVASLRCHFRTKVRYRHFRSPLHHCRNSCCAPSCVPGFRPCCLLAFAPAVRRNVSRLSMPTVICQLSASLTQTSDLRCCRGTWNSRHSRWARRDGPARRI